MANKTILMSKIRQILRSFTQGKSKVQISDQTGKSTRFEPLIPSLLAPPVITTLYVEFIIFIEE